MRSAHRRAKVDDYSWKCGKIVLRINVGSAYIYKNRTRQTQGKFQSLIDSLTHGEASVAMRIVYATCIVFALEFRESSTFDLGNWLRDAVNSIRNSEPAIKV
ncbi:hypothetical protein OESDEN_09935 [Oesophagostomum dentatum]|uniref:Uncharacterized protein n=1 Tax=Oesophagostomum dentatum TaxID=61180 RepID=A0A0B1SZ26_OESDE|nr:hypothetical protein OESDEN_09935 [Oesophagostomum dentatum]